MYSDIDIHKIVEFVGDAVERYCGSIVDIRVKKRNVVFTVIVNDLERVEDCVNQQFGHYAYPWTSSIKGNDLLIIAREYNEHL